ncbi:MAG: hypothetical protein Q8R31_00015 [Candidatus Omnitrophota bacterium]|nr:hypothetical protein [Candidatus Omnitrophota bacterium]
METVEYLLLDRIDIHIELPYIKYKELTDTKEAESSTIIKARVKKIAFGDNFKRFSLVVTGKCFILSCTMKKLEHFKETVLKTPGFFITHV